MAFLTKKVLLTDNHESKVGVGFVDDLQFITILMSVDDCNISMNVSKEEAAKFLNEALSLVESMNVRK